MVVFPSSVLSFFPRRGWRRGAPWARWNQTKAEELDKTPFFVEDLGRACRASPFSLHRLHFRSSPSVPKISSRGEATRKDGRLVGSSVDRSVVGEQYIHFQRPTRTGVLSDCGEATPWSLKMRPFVGPSGTFLDRLGAKYAAYTRGLVPF